LWNSVVSWRGLAIRFTDGICPRCLQRFRSENRSFLDRKRVEDLVPLPATAPQQVA
jgi:hypothetical protein